jgi:23S rRNA (uracil1939-C5)-methyltransferase
MICKNTECIGCRYKNISYQEGIENKFKYLQKTLKNWEHLIAPVRHVEQQDSLNYRNKITLSAHWDSSNVWKIGLWKKEELIPIPDCPIQSHETNTFIADLISVLPPYSEFPLAYIHQIGKQITLILKSKKRPDIGFLKTAMDTKSKKYSLEGLWLHLNPSAGRRLFEKVNWELIWGQELSQNQFGLYYGPATFQQLIPSLYADSLEQSIEFFKPDNKSLIIDLYCGTGNSLRVWRKATTILIGVELSGEAVKCAKTNIPEAIILRGKCEERIPQMNDIIRNLTAETKVFLYANPPRTGLEAKITEWIVTECNAKKIAYLSCSAGTLKRDLEIFERNGYNIASIIPYDFFPYTHHVETLCLIEKK